MSRRSERGRLQRALALLLALSWAVPLDLQAQPANPETGDAATPTAPGDTPKASPGLIDELGKLLKNAPSLLPTPTPAPPAPEAAPQSPGAPPASTLPTVADPAVLPAPAPPVIPTPQSLIVTGRAVCPLAANGAPDCKAGADKLCQGKGFREGKSLNSDAAESCSPKVFIPGRKREPGDCRMENFVTRALCQ